MKAQTADEQQYDAPELLTSDHDVSEFDCGEASLNDWLHRRALKNQERGGTRTYVVCAGMKVLAYYSLAANAVRREVASSKVSRNMPDPIPVTLLGRLAVDRRYQERGFGKGMLKDAVLRTLQAADKIGIRAIMVHALNEDAKRYYQRRGFHESPIDPMMLFITLVRRP